MDTEVRTFNFDDEFEDIDNLYQYLVKNPQIIEEKTGIRISEEALLHKHFCITGKESITERNILFYASNNAMPEDIGNLIVLAEATEADIIVFIVEKINPAILHPMNWLAAISNEDTEFILAEAKFKKTVSD